MHIAAVSGVTHTLIPRLEALHGAIEAKVQGTGGLDTVGEGPL